MPAHRLAPAEVHVWSLALDVEAAVVDRLRGALAPEEVERAARFRLPETAARFIVARAGLRGILGAYLGCEPATIRFAYGPSGKPALESPRPEDLRFNVSHSEALALYALALGRRLGVDVEGVPAGGEDGSASAIAARYFSSEQVAAILAARGSVRHRLFSLCWTRHEAYLKAEGRGLAAERPEPPAAVRAVPSDVWPGDPLVTPDPSGRPWTLLDLAPAGGYVGTVVAEGSGLRITHREWRVP